MLAGKFPADILRQNCGQNQSKKTLDCDAKLCNYMHYGASEKGRQYKEI
jgi:hypothetical protein